MCRISAGERRLFAGRPCRYGAAGLRVPPSLAALLLLAAVTPARAWDHVGHMLVAEIAAERLSPEVRRAVDADLAVFNTRFQTHYDLVNAACWMDDVRSQTKQYDTWHYIDIELQHPAPPLGRPTPNALWLANGCLEILAGRGALGPAHDGQPIDRPARWCFSCTSLAICISLYTARITRIAAGTTWAFPT